MIGGKATDFINRIYSCQDTIFLFHGIKYWFQGYMPNDNSVYMEIVQYQPPSDNILWSCTENTIDECMNAFITEPFFDGKSFWDAEQSIAWVDD